FPFRLQVRPDAQPPLPQQRIAAFCAAEKIRCLDLLPALRAAGEGAYIDYDHFSPQGARLVADQVAESALLAEDDGRADDAATAARGPVVAATTGSARGRSVRELMKAVEGGSAVDRAAAARALGTIGASAGPAARPLATALADPDARVRAAAAWALGALGEDA